MYHYYYLYRLLANYKDPIANPLPPDYYKSTAPPAVVVRQLETTVYVLFLKEQKAFRIERQHATSVLSCFIPEKTLFLYEPGSISDPVPSANFTAPMFTALSPNPLRYKSFSKRGADTYYMPTFEYSELVLIRNHLLSVNAISEEMRPHFADHEFRERFTQFGGIFRSMFPTTEGRLHYNLRKRNDAIDALSIDEILKLRSIETYSDDESPSTFIATYAVSTETFRNYKFEILCKDLLDVKADTLRFADYQHIMRTYDQKQSFHTAIPKSFERYLLHAFARGVSWTLAEVDLESGRLTGKSSRFKLQSSHRECAAYVAYDSMEPSVLYYPRCATRPVVDVFYKDTAGCIHGFQTTTEREATQTVDQSAVEQLRESLGIPVENPRGIQFKYYYVPLASWSAATLQQHKESANKTKTKSRPVESSSNFLITEVAMLVIPERYGLTQER
jgi:hypothetical protein